MAIENHVFPQSGDSDYAENFAAHLGRSNISDYVEEGMDFTNLSGTSADVTKGKAFIMKTIDSVSDGSDRYDTDYMVHISTTTVSLTDLAVNYIYLVPKTGTNDSPTVTAYTDKTKAGSNDLLIGEIDTNYSPPETTKLNRNPDVEFDRLRSYIDLGIPVYSDVSNAETGEGNVVFATGSGASTQGIWVYDGSGWDYSGIQSLRDSDVSGVNGLIEDIITNQPAAGEEGRLFFASDEQSIYYDNGSSWVRLALDASQITASDLGFNPATQTELNNHAGTAEVHHAKTSTLDELSDADVTELVIDTKGNRPAAGTSNRVFIARDTGEIFHDTGSSWTLVAVSSHSQLQNITSSDHHARYTDEEAQDTINALLAGGNAIGLTYDDVGNALTIDVNETAISHDNLMNVSAADHHARYTDEEARDATSTMLSGGTNVSLTKDDAGNTVTIDTAALNAEEVEDRVNTLLAGGNAVNLTYDDANSSLTVDVAEGGISHDNLAGVSSADHHARYTDEEAQDATNALLAGGANISLTYDDAGNALTVDVAQGANSGLDADTLDGVHLANVSWADVAMAQSDVSLADVGTANATLDMAAYDVLNAATIEAEHGPLIQGTDPRESISESTSPTSFDFSGTVARDIHDSTDVTVANGSSTSATEDVTVELYDGTDTTGTLLQSQTKSVSVNATSTKTVAFIPNDLPLDTGTYHINITTSGTTLGINTTVEHTKGGRYTLDQTTTGDLYLDNQDGQRVFTVDAISDEVDVTGGNLRVSGGDLLDSTGSVIYDQSAGHIPETSVQQGAGSGLDADLLDGVHASAFASSYTVSDGGAQVLSEPTDINFSNNITVTDDGDGTITVEGSSSSDTHTDVSDDGTTTVSSTGDINFSTNLAVTDDGDGTVTVDVGQGAGSGLDADLLDGLDSGQFLRSDANDTWKAGGITFEGPDDASGSLTIQAGANTSATGTPSMKLDVNNVNIVDGATTVWDSSSGYVPQSQLDIANVTWADVSLNQGDISVADLGAANANLNMNGYGVGNIGSLELDGTFDTNGNNIDLDNGDQFLTIHDGHGNYNLKSGVDPSNTIVATSGGTHVQLAEGGAASIMVDSGTATGNAFTTSAELEVNGSGTHVKSGGFVLPVGTDAWA